MGHTGLCGVWSADCITYLCSESVLPGSASNGEAADLKLRKFEMLWWGLENDATYLLPARMPFHYLGEHLGQVPVLNEEVRMREEALWC